MMYKYYFIIACILCACSNLVDVPQVHNQFADKKITSTVFITESSLPYTAWWYNFSDIELNSFVRRALLDADDIKIAIHQVMASQAMLNRVQMHWVPNITVGGNATFGQIFNSTINSDNPQMSSLSPSTSFNFSTYGFGLVPVYSLNIFKQINNQKIANINLLKSKYVVNGVRLAVISQVINSYFTLLELNEELSLRQTIIDQLTALVAFAQNQYQHGYIAHTDLNQYEIELHKQKMIIPDLKSNILLAQNALKLLTNSDNIINSNISHVKINGLIPSSISSDVLKHRPDILQAEADLRIAHVNINVARSNFFPEIAITTPVGLFSSALGNLFKSSGDFWQMQINAFMPVLNLEANAMIDETKSRYNMAYFNYIKAVKNAFMQINNTTYMLDNIANAYNTVNYLKKLADDNIHAASVNYEYGLISKSDYLITKVNNMYINVQQIQLKLKKLQLLINLYGDLGAGGQFEESRAQ
jgi:multidrug efflux system outer membrane protein